MPLQQWCAIIFLQLPCWPVFYCNDQGSIMVPWGGIMVYTFLGGGSNEVLSYSCHIHMIAILACIYGDMSNAVSWSSTLCGAPKQSKLGIAVFIYGMICSKTHHCSNELPSYIYDFDFGLFLSWWCQCGIMVPWGGIMVHTHLGSSIRVKYEPCHLDMGYGKSDTILLQQCGAAIFLQMWVFVIIGMWRPR